MLCSTERIPSCCDHLSRDVHARLTRDRHCVGDMRRLQRGAGCGALAETRCALDPHGATVSICVSITHALHKLSLVER